MHNSSLHASLLLGFVFKRHFLLLLLLLLFSVWQGGKLVRLFYSVPVHLIYHVFRECIIFQLCQPFFVLWIQIINASFPETKFITYLTVN